MKFLKKEISSNNGTLICNMDLPLISCTHHSLGNPLTFKLIYKLEDALSQLDLRIFKYVLILTYSQETM